MLIKINKEVFDVSVADSLFSHLRGLMFSFPKNDGLLFKFNKEVFVSLHMFFVFFPIDIVYINEKFKVIKIRKRVFPFTPFIAPVKCKYILELKGCKNVKVDNKIVFNKIYK